MSKNFFQIFKESFGREKEEPVVVDAEGFTTIDIEIPDEAQELVVYMFMNNGALLERDRIMEALGKHADSRWAQRAMDEINKIPRSLPKDVTNKETDK